MFVSRKGGSDFFDHAIGEVFLIRITAHVLEWQYRDGRFIGEREGQFFRFCLGGFGAFASFFLHLSDETETLSRQCLDEALFLAGIADQFRAAFRRVVSAASDTIRPFQMALMSRPC